MTESRSSPNISGTDTAEQMLAASAAEVFTCVCAAGAARNIQSRQTTTAWLYQQQHLLKQ